MMGYKFFYLIDKEKLGGIKFVEIKSLFLDIVDFICFVDYLCSNKGFICILVVYCFYFNIVFFDVDCGNFVFYF